MISQKSKVLLFALFLSIIVLALTSCGAGFVTENSLTLSEQEHWTMESRLTIPPQTLNVFGGEAGIEPSVQQGLADARNKGRQIAMRKEHLQDGSLVYVFDASGDDWRTLTDTWTTGTLSINAQESNGQRQVHISFDPSSTTSMGPLTFHLIAGSIISSNADEVKGNTATWYLRQSRQVDAVVTEVPRFGVQQLLLIGGGLLCAIILIVGIVLGIFAVSRRRRPTTV